jgi:tetratricopeptide (TPR) repeat protein
MTRVMWSGVVLAVWTSVAQAQTQDPVALALTATAVGGWQEPAKACADQLHGGDFRVNSGKTYYKTAMEQSNPSNRTRILRNAQSNLIEAVGAGQGKLATTWYWLGRTDLGLGDVAGADSSFNRAVAIAPGCKDDINAQRSAVWSRVVGFAEEKQKAGAYDDAIVFFRAASTLNPASAVGDLSMANIFMQQKHEDSALAYFMKAAEVPVAPGDTAAAAWQLQAMYNSGVMLVSAKRYPEAVTEFQDYLAIVPTDTDAQKGLIQAYRGAGMADSAKAVEARLASASGASAGTAGGYSPEELFELGTSQFQAADFAAAAQSFGKVLELEPWRHDALHNQASAYVQLKDGPALIADARRLLSYEPLNEGYVKMYAYGFQLTKQQDSLIRVANELAALPVTVEISQFKPGAEGASVVGVATGRAATEPSGKPLKPVAVTLVMDFLDRKGTVISSQEVSIPALAEAKDAPITASGQGAGIVAWRYRRK